MGLTNFDKACAVVACVAAVPLIGLGLLGVVTGTAFVIALPPIVAGILAIAGWGVLRSVYVAWSLSETPTPPTPVLVDRRGRVAQGFQCSRCGENLRSIDVDGKCPSCARPIRKSARNCFTQQPEQARPTQAKPESPPQ